MLLEECVVCTTTTTATTTTATTYLGFALLKHDEHGVQKLVVLRHVEQVAPVT